MLTLISNRYTLVLMGIAMAVLSGLHLQDLHIVASGLCAAASIIAIYVAINPRSGFGEPYEETSRPTSSDWSNNKDLTRAPGRGPSVLIGQDGRAICRLTN